MELETEEKKIHENICAAVRRSQLILRLIHDGKRTRPVTANTFTIINWEDLMPQQNTLSFFFQNCKDNREEVVDIGRNHVIFVPHVPQPHLWRPLCELRLLNHVRCRIIYISSLLKNKQKTKQSHD